MFNLRRSCARAGRPRRLDLDRLEQRTLMSVSPTELVVSADRFQNGGLTRLSSDLAQVSLEYTAYTNAHGGSGEGFEARSRQVMQTQTHVLVEAAALNNLDALKSDLVALGGTRVQSFGHVASALVPFTALPHLNNTASVAAAWSVQRPRTNAGAVNSQGDINLRTNEARTQYAVDGTGVTVGVLSDSFNALDNATADVHTGDLPPLEEITVLSDFPPVAPGGFFLPLASDEGRGMMQIVHDLAPGADLAFHSAFFGQVDFANGILRLANEANADVIVDDVAYFAEPFFQDGIIAQAADAVAQQGVSYFSAAGNAGFDSFEGFGFPKARLYSPPDNQGIAHLLSSPDDEPIAPASRDIGPFFMGGYTYNFGGGDDLQRMFIPEGGFLNIVMQWDSPFFSVSGVGSPNDFDIYLLNEDANTVVAASNTAQVDFFGNSTFADPVEILQFVNDTGQEDFQLMLVKRFAVGTATYQSSDTPVVLPDDANNENAVFSVINADAPGNVRDVRVTLNLLHPNVQDVSATLIAPDGTEITLFANIERQGSNFLGTTLTLRAALPIGEGLPPFTGNYRPVDDFEDILGIPAAGQWLLQLEDTDPQNRENTFGGTLINWSLEIDTDDNPTPDPGRLKYIVYDGAEFITEHLTGGSTIVGHANATGAAAIGAVPYYNAPGFGSANLTPEPFSSWGGTPIIFDTSGSRLPTPEFRAKPWVMGPDGGDTTFFPPGPFALPDVEGNNRPNFFGTSASAPHVAGVAALMHAWVEDATPVEVLEALATTTLPIDAPSILVGSGFVQADAAIGRLGLLRPSKIEGVKFQDLDGDGVRDPGEPPLEGFEVFLDQNNNGVRDSIRQEVDGVHVPTNLVDDSIVRVSQFVGGIPSIIDDVNFSLDITHTAAGDLRLTLVSPSGTRIPLARNRGGLGDNFTGTTFDDEATALIAGATAPFRGTFRPESELALLDGENPNGLWVLEIEDSVPFNLGILNSFSLDISYTEPTTRTDAEGRYRFENLPPGTYNVAEVLPPGWRSTTTQGGSAADGDSPVLLTEVSAEFRAGFEYENFAETPQDLTGWVAILSDSPFANILDVNARAVPLVPADVFDSTVVPRVIRHLQSVTSTNEVTGLAAVDPFGLTTPATVASIEVTLDIVHPDVSELELALVSPSGRRVRLSAVGGPSGADFRQTTFSDQGATSILGASAPLLGRYRPAEPLSALRGEVANGTWRLEITTSAGAVRDGVLNRWSLAVTTEMAPRQVRYVTDSPSDHYFGSDIYWNKNNTREGSGWVMLLDAAGKVRDWVGWGWDAADLASFALSGVQVTYADPATGGTLSRVIDVGSLAGSWTGSAVVRTGPGNLQRQHNMDTDSLGDWLWHPLPTLGFENRQLLEFPFILQPESTGSSQFLRPDSTNTQDFGNRTTSGAPVVLTTVPRGAVDGPVDHLDISFSELMDTTSFDPVTDILSFTRSASNVLDDFVQAEDPFFRWEVVQAIPGADYTAYLLAMTTQSWRTPSEVNRTLWQHQLAVVVPNNVEGHTALFIIGGGDNDDPLPPADQRAVDLARQTRSIVAALLQVPNQPLTFSDDVLPGAKSEDALLASSFDQFLRSAGAHPGTGEQALPALLPMVKSAVRGMDAVQEFIDTFPASIPRVDDFVINGASKRGWTTWLTGAADDRVRGIMPFVFDALNSAPQLEHHGLYYGGNTNGTVADPTVPSRRYAEAISDYIDYDIGTVNGAQRSLASQLRSIVDPFSYRDRLELPKLSTLSAGDEFFVTDSQQFYFNQLPGARYLRLVPGVGHGLSDPADPSKEQDVIDSTQAFYEGLKSDETLPNFFWFFNPLSGALSLQAGPNAGDRPTSVKLWQATNATARDFRFGYTSAVWNSTTLTEQSSGLWVGTPTSTPTSGFTAFFVEVTYARGAGEKPFKFTTDAAIMHNGVLETRATYTGSTQGGPAIPLTPAEVDLRSAITGFEWLDGKTLRLHFTPQTAQADYRLVLGPELLDLDGNPLDQDGDGTAGESVEDRYTAEFATRSRIEGSAFSDLNSNGVHDSGEPLVPGVTLYLDLNADGTRDAGEPFDVTGDDGLFRFEHLLAGTYLLVVEPRAGLVPVPLTQTLIVGQNGPVGQAEILSGVTVRLVPSAVPWQSVGPQPITQGQVAGMEEFDKPVTGAVQAVVPHPADPETVYVGTVNGGIWKTTNFNSASGPIWRPLTDGNQYPSLSIGALDVDYTDPNVLMAGIGRFSNADRDGGSLTGLLLSRNGGSSWQPLTSLVAGKNISAVASRNSGQLLLAAANSADTGQAGLYRSDNGGVSFTLISGTTGSGLPVGPVRELVGDPTNPARFYAGVLGTQPGLFRSDDGGQHWTSISAGIPDIGTTTRHLRVAVHRGDARVIYAGVINGAQLVGVFRSTDAGGTWTRMDLPVTFENGQPVGLNFAEAALDDPGSAGLIHFSLAADPVNPNTVYVGGGRQPGNFSLPPFVTPNSIGATNFTGRLFRGDASLPLGRNLQWRPLTDDFANGTGPHSESRDLAFDSLGRLLEADDGGVYVLSDPDGGSRFTVWEPRIGNLQITEFYSVAYDSNSNTLFGGAVDVGVPAQVRPGSTSWREVSQGVGAIVAVDDSLPFVSYRYFSNPSLANFTRASVTPANDVTDFEFPALRLASGSGTLFSVDTPQPITPLELNRVIPRSLVIGTQTHVFESFDQGETVTDLGNLNAEIGALAYGGREPDLVNPGQFISRPNVLYVGAGAALYARSANSVSLLRMSAYPGGTVQDIVVDPDDWRHAYVVDETDVFATTNGGATWTTLTDTLTDSHLRSVEFVRRGDLALLLAGGNSGVYATLVGGPPSWFEVGAGLPNVPVSDLRYDPQDDVLVVGTLGRGAFTQAAFGYSLGGGLPPESNLGPTLPFAVQDLGSLYAQSLSGVDGNAYGGAWYRFTPVNAGLLTVQTGATSGASLVLYDADLRPVASGSAADLAARMDVAVRSGQTYYLQVVGGSSATDLALTNVVRTEGTNVTLQGTAENDLFVFTAGARFNVSLNGVEYTFDPAEVSSVTFEGNGGRDSGTVTDATGDLLAVLRPGTGSVTGGNYAVEFHGVSLIVVNGGSGFGRAQLYDGEADDQFVGSPSTAQLSGDGYFNLVRGFRAVQAYGSLGNDTATLYDSRGDGDQFVSSPVYGQMSGNGYFNYAQGFDTVHALSSNGQDSATFYDSPGADTISAGQGYLDISGTGYNNDARGFRNLRAFSSGGDDRVTLNDTGGDDYLTIRPEFVQLNSAGYVDYLRGFRNVRAYATSGNDTVDLYSAGGEGQLMARPRFVQVSNAGYFAAAANFDVVRAFGSGGDDTATLFGEAGDQLVATPSATRFSGPTFSTTAYSFATVRAFSGGGDSHAILYDTLQDDQLFALATLARLEGGDIAYWAWGFANVSAVSTVGNDTKDVLAIDYVLETVGDWLDP